MVNEVVHDMGDVLVVDFQFHFLVEIIDDFTVNTAKKRGFAPLNHPRSRLGSPHAAGPPLIWRVLERLHSQPICTPPLF